MTPYKIGISMPGFEGLLAYWVVQEFQGGIRIDNRAKGIWNSTARLWFQDDTQTHLRNEVGQIFEIKWSDKHRAAGVTKKTKVVPYGEHLYQMGFRGGTRVSKYRTDVLHDLGTKGWGLSDQDGKGYSEFAMLDDVEAAVLEADRIDREDHADEAAGR